MKIQSDQVSNEESACRNVHEQKLKNVFTIILRYIEPMEDIDIHLDARARFLEKNYRGGAFIVSGPQIPRPGGAIIALGCCRDEVSRILADDPFHIHGLAEYHIYEFEPTRMSEDFRTLAERQRD